MSEIIFEMTKDHLETGLRGVPVGYCTTSQVDPQKGLYYRGRPIKELADLSSEKVIHLLMHGRFPEEQEMEKFKGELFHHGRCSDELIRHIESMPRCGHPMKLFVSAILTLGMMEGENDYYKDALNLIAKLPHLLAVVMNFHAGWGETTFPRENQGYIQNFAHMLQVPGQDPKLLGEVLRLFHILHLDHGGGNLSAFTGKAVASGLEDLYGSIAAAMCALEGPRHGKANQEGLQFVHDVHSRLGSRLTPEAVEEVLREKMRAKEVIYGFGHAVLRVEDPRATIFYEFAQKHFPDNPLVQTMLYIRERGTGVLSENPKISNPYPNVDAASGTVLHEAGLPYPEYYTTLFGLARSVGITIQILYERLEAKGGKGTPIVRPKYFYKPS